MVEYRARDGDQRGVRARRRRGARRAARRHVAIRGLDGTGSSMLFILLPPHRSGPRTGGGRGACRRPRRERPGRLPCDGGVIVQRKAEHARVRRDAQRGLVGERGRPTGTGPERQRRGGDAVRNRRLRRDRDGGAGARGGRGTGLEVLQRLTVRSSGRFRPAGSRGSPTTMCSEVEKADQLGTTRTRVSWEFCHGHPWIESWRETCSASVVSAGVRSSAKLSAIPADPSVSVGVAALVTFTVSE